MGGTNRRWYAFLGATCALIAAGIAAGVVLTFSGTSAAAPTKKQYFAEVAAIWMVSPITGQLALVDSSRPRGRTPVQVRHNRSRVWLLRQSLLR